MSMRACTLQRTKPRAHRVCQICLTRSGDLITIEDGSKVCRECLVQQGRKFRGYL